ncbi:MAG: DPP IV N-terminal domain-containing protein [Phycisphaerales bacterium]|nr:DPP IV N-terminal domain-containing protein [Phycisphaerales bacterium]
MIALVSALVCTAAALQPTQPGGDPLLTVAERSRYTATSTSAQVGEFIADLAHRSPLLRVSTIGKTFEGKDIPLVILADPPVETPEQAAASGKLLILAFGNIHAGEVDGKEALLALMRDMALGGDEVTKGRSDEEENEAAASLRHSVTPSLLSNCVFALVPIYNADGNDKMSRDSRPGQVGPSEGQGIRENAQGFDLNRDYVKLEAPETRALVRFINRWDPALIIDCHTTNGSWHRYPMTYGGPKHPAGDPRIITLVNDHMLPEIGKAVMEQFGLDTNFYGNFEKNHTTWEDYPDQPRYGGPYVGIRNRLPVLNESYSYATYEERIKAQEHFLLGTFQWAADHKDEIKKLLADADRKVIDAGNNAEGEVPVRTKAVPFEKKVVFKGWVEKEVNGKNVRTDEPKDYEVDLVADFKPTLTVPRPFAYVIPKTETEVVQNLQRHGIKAEELRETLEVDAEVYRIDSITRAEREYQKHHAVAVEATRRAEPRTLDAGSFIVRTGQKLGSLAVFLLEPQASDGLTTWNFFDAGLSVGADFPVLRIPRPTPLLTTDAAPLPEDAPTPRPITFDDLSGRDAASLSGSPAGGFDWLPDGEHYTVTRDGKNWKIDARTGRAEPAYDPDPARKALAALSAFSDRAARDAAARPRTWNEGRTAFLVSHENDLYYATADGLHAVRLTHTPAAEELPTFSPDAAFVAFVRDSNLYVVDIATRTERALTTDGSPDIRNGKADWVYEEEVYGRGRPRVYWWSPDSSRIAFLRVDSSAEPRYAIVNNSQLKQRVEDTAYPKPGEPNPTVRVFTVTAAGGDPRELDLSTYNPATTLVTSLTWTPDSSSFITTVTNRTQTWMDIVSAPADAGDPTVLFRETTKAWIDEAVYLKFLRDGSFLFSSERDGWKHLYRYAADGTSMGRVTRGDWECRSVARVDEAEGVLYFTGTRDSHTADNLYRVPLDGGDPVRLTTEPGSHRVQVAPTGDLFIDSWSSTTQTPRVALRSLRDGSLVRTLDTNPVRDLARFTLGEFSAFQIAAPDGFPLEATLLKPPDFDPARKYPAWFMTYGGPHAPTISDSWSAGPGRAWDQALAAEGFLVFRADPRSASGKGAVSAWACYKQLGVSEMADIEAAINWLNGQPGVDPARVGMAGHSYGGFMTAYALTHSKLFAAGIAGAPVTDWREYDSIYTERYMLTPAENPDGYTRTSVVEAAKNLHGRLLLAHGMIDDNVHLQNNTRLVRALQAANKTFEMMLYPDSRHGIGGKHYQDLQVDFILRTLGTPRPAREPSLGDHP